MNELRKVHLFRDLPDTALAEIEPYLKPQPYAAGETIFNKGDPGDQIFFIESGQVVVFDPAAGGVPVRTFGEGGMFGELAVIDRNPRTLSALAESDCKVWALRAEDFARVILENKALVMDILISLSASIRYTTTIFLEAAHRSIHDPLTGLYNRSLFESMAGVLEEGHRQAVTVIIADIDGLKQVNDSQGHAQGDALIKNVANILRSAFRPDDIVARIGGDEFAIILPGVDEPGGQQAAERIQGKLQAYNQAHPQSPVSFSVGFVTGGPNAPVEAVIKEADARMYAAKERQGVQQRRAEEQRRKG
jgi:diguanylate cyclase (GGDEF)-like protein